MENNERTEDRNGAVCKRNNGKDRQRWQSIGCKGRTCRNANNSLAALNDSINKVSFNRMVEEAKKRAKPFADAMRSILVAA